MGERNEIGVKHYVRVKKPPYQYVALHFCSLNQTLFLHFSSRRPSEPASKRLDMWTFGQLLSALLPRRFPSRPLHSETVNKWVGLQPNGNEGKQRGLFGVLLNICIDQAVLPRTHEQQTIRWKINISLSEITDFFLFLIFFLFGRGARRERGNRKSNFLWNRETDTVLFCFFQKLYRFNGMARCRWSSLSDISFRVNWHQVSCNQLYGWHILRSPTCTYLPRLSVTNTLNSAKIEILKGHGWGKMMPVRIYDELPVLLSYGAHFCPFYYSNPYLKPDFLLLLTVTCNDQNYKEGGGVCACARVCVLSEQVMVLKCHTRSLTISWLLLYLYIHGSHPEGIINLKGTYQQDRKEMGGKNIKFS